MTNYKKLDQVFNLVAKTNDKVIVISEKHDPYVVMNLREYESLLQGFSPVNDLSEEQLLERINRDIAIWKSSQDDLDDYDLESFKLDSLKKDEEKPNIVEDKLKSDIKDEKVDVNTAAIDEDDKYYIEPVD